jgi:transposase
MIPSVDAYLVDALGFRRDVRRLPITELGCVGGASALARAHDFLRGFPDARVLVIAVELPSLSLQRDDTTPANLVASALFGDGAAAAVLSGDGDRPGVRVLDTLSHIFPNSTGKLGFDLHEDGFHSVISKDIPALLKSEIVALVDRLAARAGLTQTAVSRIWRAFALAPHRAETFKLSKDPQFIEKVRDVVGLYLNPPDRALLLAVDEKTQIPAREPTAPVVPMQPGQLERHTHDYVRHGTTDLFAALDVRAGTVIGETHRRHRSTEFRHFLDTIDRNTPAALDVHLILDNSAIHKTPLVQRWLVKRPRFHVHFTPTSASWLNLVECWFSILQRRELARGVHRSTYALEQALRHYIASTNEHPKPFVWTKTADEILASVARFCQRTSPSHH